MWGGVVCIVRELGEGGGMYGADNMQTSSIEGKV